MNIKMFSHLNRSLKLRQVSSLFAAGVLFSILINAPYGFAQYAEFEGGDGTFEVAREDHHVSEYSGWWRNLIFTDNISLSGRSEYQHFRGTFPWWDWDPPSRDFMLIARNTATDECVRCTYEGHEDYYLVDDNGYIVGWDFNPDWLSVERKMNRVPTTDPPGGQKWEFSHWQLEINRTPSNVWRASVPEGINIVLYYGTDFISTLGNEQSEDLQIVGYGKDNYGETWTTWWDYLSDSGLSDGVWQVSDTMLIGEPAEAPVDIEFVKYLEKTSDTTFTDGIDWIPNPENDLKKYIGLVFTSTDSTEELESRIAYEVFDITTWQGMSMNEPNILSDDDKPHPTGNTDRFFDFKVYNPTYVGEDTTKYNIRIIDTDEVIEDSKGAAMQTYSTRRYTVQRNVPVKTDTLWLIAQDYAAHAVVMAHGWYDSQHIRNDGYTNPITGEDLWAITVPRDYDGYRNVGVNKGDYMADMWEQENAYYDTLKRDSELLLSFYPFYVRDTLRFDTTTAGDTVYTFGDFDINFPADQDSFLTGVDIRGDRFMNFEEYRGFHCTGDPDTPEYSSLTHQRFDPRNKTLLIDWRRPFNLREVREAVPLFDNKLDPTEMFYVDAFILNDDSTRFSNNRHVALNRKGASFIYVSVPTITSFPLPATPVQNAISFWILNPAEANLHRQLFRTNPNYPVDPDRTEAWSISGRYFNGTQYPEFNSRIVVAPNNLREFLLTQGTYYDNNPNEWDAALADMIVWLFHHEMGHTVAMKGHEVSQYYMRGTIPYQEDRQHAEWGKFFPAGTVFDYSNSSKTKFSIVPPPLPQQP